jgi:hypothetical protein
MSSASHDTRDQRHQEQNDENPEEKARTFHSHARDTTKSNGRSDQGNNEEYERIMQQISHDGLLLQRELRPRRRFLIVQA